MTSTPGFTDDELQALCQQHTTPFYVYDVDTVRDNIAELQQAFPDWQLRFSAKANINRAIIKTVHDEGLGFVCGSPKEIERLRRGGVPLEDILYVAVQPSDDQIQEVISFINADKLTISIESLDTLHKLVKHGYDGSGIVRINSNYFTDEETFTPRNAKFGLSPQDAIKAFQKMNAEGIEQAGLYCHTGKMKNERRQRLFYESLEGLSDFIAATNTTINHVNVGGGLSVKFTDELEPDLDAMREHVEHIFDDHDITLTLEPGRYIVANAGVTCTEVTGTKDTPVTKVVSVDLASHHLALNHVWDEPHEITNISRDAPATEQSVSGPSCTAHSGYHCLNQSFTASQTDDFLVVEKTGAYAHYLGNNFHSQPRPKILIKENDNTYVSRREATLDEIMQCERHKRSG